MLGRVFIKGELRKVISVQGRRRHLNVQWFGGRKGKIEHGVMGGCWGAGVLGRMREIGRGNGSTEAKWVEARMQG